MTRVFTLCPPMVTETRVRRCARTDRTTGHSRARAINPRTLRQWHLEWPREKANAAVYVEQFRNEVGVLAFDWTPPFGLAVVSVRIMGPTRHRTFISTVSTSLELDLEEVR